MSAVSRESSSAALLQKQRSHVLFVLSNAEAGREAEFLQWYQGAYRHTVSNAACVLSVQHYARHEVDITRGRYPKLPFEYLGLYELAIDGAEAAASLIEQITLLYRQQPAAQAPATWLYYPVSDKVGRSPAVPSLLILAFANALPGQEAEFREWYATRHIRHALYIPVLTSGQCFERTQFQSAGAAQPAFNTIAVYEQEGTPEDFIETAYSLPAGLLSFPALDKSRFAEAAYRPLTLTYPATRIDDATNVLSGVASADPYRWLEADTEAVKRWQRAQTELAAVHVREWPHFDQLQRLVEKFGTERYVTLPSYAAGRWFRAQIAAGASQSCAVVSDEPLGEGTVLFDPVSENPERPPFLSWLAPSPDGRTLALGVCTDGSENNTIRLIDVASGRLLANPPPHTLMDNWLGGVSWLPDSSGFFFSAIAGAAADLVQSVYLHRRGPAPTTVPVDVAWTSPKDYRVVLVSRDGRYAVALERLYQPIPVAIARLGQGPLQWRPFVTSIKGAVAGHVIGDRYIAITDVGASRGRLVAIALDAQDPNDPGSWQELIGESDVVLRAATPIGDRLYLTELVDTYARLRMVDFNGKALGEVSLPDRGAISELSSRLMNLVPKGHPDKFLFGFSSLTVSPGIYVHEPREAQIQTLRPPRVRLEDTIVQGRWAVSADDTRIPYHLVRRADLDVGRTHPTLIYAYGGHYVPWLPQFPGPMAAFVAAGGVFIHAHLRGGGEFGLDWWHDGCMRKTQNSYDDLYAIAEDLFAAGVCTPQSLAVTGLSHGGLMAGVAITQRPELWAVSVPRVPIFDLIGGACRSLYNRWSTSLDRADVEDPQEVRRLATFSPYQLVRDGVRYPAVFIEAGDTDPRGAPWHARKFAARLQAATAGSAPILLHIWENVGHGHATDRSIAVTQNTEWLAFTMRHLGLEWPR